MTKKRVDPVQQLADKLIEQMEASEAPWQKPWEASLTPAPYNASTNKPYRGFNNLNLALSGHLDPRWMTFKQAKDLGYSVRKGEKGTPLLFYNFHKEEAQRDANGRIMKDEQGKTIKQKVQLERPIVRIFYVFNGEQIEGLPPYEIPKRNEVKNNERIEALLTKSGAEIVHEHGDRAFYRPSEDKIVLPLKEQFKSTEHYYSTALHELGHWTGHESRLDRGFTNNISREDYAREELRAEISSMLVGQELGLRHDPSNHIAYTKDWIQLLKDEPKEILYAVRDAQKIFDHVMQFDREYTQKSDLSTTQEVSKSPEPTVETELEEELDR